MLYFCQKWSIIQREDLSTIKAMDMINLKLPSVVEEITFNGKKIFLKRDDKIHSEFSGNKARKFYYYFNKELPQIKKVISYGSNQSNAMYSLSVLAKMRGWEFEYFVNHIPSYLKDNPQGNYKGALENGTLFNIDKTPNPKSLGDDILFIQEGGRESQAEEGLALLAKEIINWQREKGIKELEIFLPSGTGTTALYLQKSLYNLGSSTRVVTLPCVGDSNYLKAQFTMLNSDKRFWAKIITPRKKYHFGKLYLEFYQVWLELYRQTGVEFDLLYDPLGWLTLIEYYQQREGEILYLHQGGIKGNESMLPRYQRKYPTLK